MRVAKKRDFMKFCVVTFVDNSYNLNSLMIAQEIKNVAKICAQSKPDVKTMIATPKAVPTRSLDAESCIFL
jgi:hypothetical protein